MKARDVSAEIAQRIAGITLVNGYQTDIGVEVFRGRHRPVTDDEPPCALIIEGADSPKDQPARIPSSLISQSYTLLGWDACDPNNPNDKGHDIVADLKRAIFHDGATLGGKVRNVKYSGKDIGPRADGVALINALIMIDVEYVEELAAQ